MQKLQFGCVIEDDKVLTDDIFDPIQEWPEVQSVDMTSMQKLWSLYRKQIITILNYKDSRRMDKDFRMMIFSIFKSDWTTHKFIFFNQYKRNRIIKLI